MCVGGGGGEVVSGPGAVLVDKRDGSLRFAEYNIIGSLCDLRPSRLEARILRLDVSVNYYYLTMVFWPILDYYLQTGGLKPNSCKYPSDVIRTFFLNLYNCFFFNLKSSQNVLVSSFYFIWIPMLWILRSSYIFYSFSAGSDFKRPNLTSTDVRFWRLKSVPVSPPPPYNGVFLVGIHGPMDEMRIDENQTPAHANNIPRWLAGAGHVTGS